MMRSLQLFVMISLCARELDVSKISIPYRQAYYIMLDSAHQKQVLFYTTTQQDTQASLIQNDSHYNIRISIIDYRHNVYGRLGETTML